MSCATPLDLAALVDYWARASDPRDADRVEDHVFACDACAARLAAIADLAAAVAEVARAGGVPLTATGALVDRWHADGLGVRVYRLGPGEHVLCTVKPADDYVVSWLAADLPAGASVRVDLTLAGHALMRLDDCPFDHARGAVILATPADVLRPLGAVDLVVRLTHDGAPVGDYHFHHAPDRPE